MRKGDDETLVIHGTWNFNVLNSVKDGSIDKFQGCFVSPDVFQFGPEGGFLEDIFLLKVHLKVDGDEGEEDDKGSAYKGGTQEG